MKSDEPGLDQLSSWKEIAEFLGVALRTAQKWERERGLPVKRLPGTKGRVLANREDLERWKAATLARPAWYSNLKVLRYVAIVSAGLLLICAATAVAIFQYHRSARPTDFRLEPKALVVLGANEKEVLRKEFERPILLAAAENPDRYARERKIWHGDFGNDLAGSTLMVPATTEAGHPGPLLCFSSHGKERWRFVPGKVVRDRQRTFDASFEITNFRVARLTSEGPPRILVLSEHASGHP